MKNIIKAIIIIVLASSAVQAEDYAVSQGQCGAFLYVTQQPAKVIKSFLAKYPSTAKSQAVAAEFAAEIVGAESAGRQSKVQLLASNAIASCQRLNFKF
jgi:hypothetical protein